MRWFWIDRFLEFECERRATAVKNISLAEEHLHDYFPGHPVMPACLVIEGLAQTGGLLVSEVQDFAGKVVLAKVAAAEFHCEAVPGDTLTYRTQIESIKEDGAMVAATSHRGDRLHAEMQIVFAFLDESFEGRTLFDPRTFLHMLRMLGVFDVGRKADGSPLAAPEWMIQAAAEQA
jgi:3-hydroxyacyl-[acyl-carrier-protein] dehydratase